MSANQLSLSELNLLIQNTLDDAFPNLMWVKAEISEMNVNHAGHCYLELVDTDTDTREILARGRATIWSYTFRMLKPYFETTTGQAFAEGIKVLVSAKIEYHPVYGLSLNIRDIDPSFTVGDMAVKRREIILRLEENGVADMNKELELPLVPQRIAIISSPTAAGLQDFLDQLENNPLKIHFHTKLFPAVMQGKGTSESIIQALDHIFRYEDLFDLVVIIRGGGAQIDLASFDNYELAFHVAQFPIPVVTGIGHDKDETVIDLVAHTKMKTPTAVAEFLINGVEAFVQHLTNMENQLADLIEERLDMNREYLESLVQQFKQGFRDRIKEELHRFDFTGIYLKRSVPLLIKLEQDQFRKYIFQLENGSKGTLKEKDHQLKRLVDEIQFKSNQLLSEKNDLLEQHKRELQIRLQEGLKLQVNKIDSFNEKARLMDPARVLKRGYSLTYLEGKLLKSISGLKAGDELTTRLADGEVISRIKK